MGEFRTEKEVESLLEMEQRQLSTYCGRGRVVQESRIVWGNFDWIVSNGIFEPERVVELAEGEAEEINLPFEMTFGRVVCYTVNEFFRKGLI